MNKVSVGVLGCGSMGIVHLTNFLKAKNVREVFVCDKSSTRLERIKRFYKTPTFSDYRQFLEKVDAVCIATPNSLHYQHAVEALNANKHVLVEKPLAMKSEDAQKLAEEAEKKHLILAVGNQKRFNPEYLKIRQDLRSGKLGNPILIKARMIGEGPYRLHKAATDWYYSREKGGGALFDLGSHMIDLVQWINPHQMMEVLGVSLGSVLNVPVEEYAFCLLRTEGNVAISIEVGWFTKFNEETLEVIGTMGKAIASPSNTTKTLRHWALSKFGSAYFKNSDYYWQDEAFINSCLKNAYVGCLATAKEGANCISVIEKIYAFFSNQKEREDYFAPR
jgi:UDP-N-acetylglucosamine 3-dehydrogenase